MNPKVITKKEKKVVWQSFVSLSTLQGINYLLPLVILPYLFRALGAGKFGLIAFAQAFVQYFMILTDYGFSLTATREISLCKDEKEQVCQIFSSVLTVKAIMTGISFLILLLVLDFVPRFGKDWLVYILSFGAVIGNTLFPVWFFQGKEKMFYITAVNMIGGVAGVICLFLFVNGPADYLYVPLFNSLVAILTGIYSLFIAFRRFELKFVFQTYEDIQQKLKAGRSLFISIVAINAYTATRVFAIGLLTNNVITGYYSIAERVANFIQTFPLTSLSQALYPRINKIYSRSKKRAARLMHKIQNSTSFIYLCILIAVYFSTPLIVKIFCPAECPELVIALRILLVSVFFVCANAFRIQFLLVLGRPDLYSRLHISAALIGLPLIFILINHLSFVGAALATVIIEAGITLFTFKIVRDLLK
ncbi:MAG: flippase [Candidatus Omnitrophica bacterium]|nr:flippase [Candidatus Omnitrophota bacterium]MDD5236530.1 flippase [Candidatus Omnitrophota bacterium]MDD5610740.1 flippase [Candidatus Omnitrophota bacterium]